MEYYTRDGKIAYVAPGSAGNFTFYIRPYTKPRMKGTRVKGRCMRLWFATKAIAEKALADYAEKRGWKPMAVNFSTDAGDGSS